MTNATDKSDGKAKKRDERTGSVVPQDHEFADWLAKLWVRDEPPDRVELWQVFGKNLAIFGEMIYHEDFRANEKLTPEQATKLSNEMWAAAQHDCDAVQRKMSYTVKVIDSHRKAEALTRRLKPFHPMRIYSQKDEGGADDGDADDDVLPNGRSLALSYTKEEFEQIRWEQATYKRVLGDLLLMYKSTIDEQRGWIDQMMRERFQFTTQIQELMDRSLDREMARKWQELKLSLATDGFRTVRNLLPGLVAKTDGQSDEHSVERQLVDNLLRDVEATGQAIALFGEWDRDGEQGIKQTKPGILSPAQFAIFVNVRDGKLPVDALDRLDPTSGAQEALAPDQIARAMQILTDGTKTALLEIVGIRQKRRAARVAAQNSNEKPNSEEKTP